VVGFLGNKRFSRLPIDLAGRSLLRLKSAGKLDLDKAGHAIAIERCSTRRQTDPWLRRQVFFLRKAVHASGPTASCIDRILLRGVECAGYSVALGFCPFVSKLSN
jgi:hypothetical protein